MLIDISNWQRFMDVAGERVDMHGWPYSAVIWYCIGKGYRHLLVSPTNWPYLMESLHKAGGRFEEDGSISLFYGKVKIEAKL